MQHCHTTPGPPDLPLPPLVCLQLSQINGLPKFVSEGIADLFGGGGTGNDPRCNSQASLAIPEFDIFADGDAKSWVSAEGCWPCAAQPAPCPLLAVQCGGN